MERILLNTQEWEELKRKVPAFLIDYARYADPTFGFTGSAPYWVVYFTKLASPSAIIAHLLT